MGSPFKMTVEGRGGHTRSGATETGPSLAQGCEQRCERKEERLIIKVRKMEREREGVEGMWKEAGEIYGDLYLIVHTKAIMG